MRRDLLSFPDQGKEKRIKFTSVKRKTRVHADERGY